MTTKKDETASFVLRFTQKIFQNDEGEPQVQWRGNIQHVQSGDEKRFSKFEEVVKFIQDKLAELTISAMEDKTPEEQKGILAKSFDLWKRMAVATPKMVMETLKDPKAGVEHIQEIQEQVTAAVQEQANEIGDLIDSKLNPDNWKPATKSDVKKLTETLSQLAKTVAALNEKVEQSSNKS